MQTSLLWITDPWSTLSLANDTTLRLMQEAINLSIPTFWGSSDFILNTSSLTTISVCEVKDLSSEPKMKVEVEPSKFHQIHYRLDPPVDFSYISTLDALIARGAGKVLNVYSPPEILKYQSEKLPPAEVTSLTPLGCVIRASSDVLQAQKLFSMPSYSLQKVVSKPLNQAQSIGVSAWNVPTDLNEWMCVTQKLTNNYAEPILIQEYLPGIAQGEVRMWFANGEFVAALKKYPKKGDFRVLIDEGSTVEAYTLNSSEHQAAQRVGTTLKLQKVKLAAIDFIQGKISDYNITSPGLLVQLEAVHGKNFAKIILEKIMNS